MASLKGYAVKIRKILTPENYERIRKMDDEKLRIRACRIILDFYEAKKQEGWDDEEIKKVINDVLEEFWKFNRLVDRLIELERIRIQKLENIRKGILPYMFEVGVDKLKELGKSLANYV